MSSPRVTGFSGLESLNVDPVQAQSYMSVGEFGSWPMGVKFEWVRLGIWFNSVQECNEDPKL